MKYIIIADKIKHITLSSDHIVIPLSFSFIPFHIYNKFSSDILTLSQILGHFHICRLGKKAKELMTKFLSAACADNYIDNIPWPEIFVNDNIFFFFWNLLLSNDLAKWLKKENPEKIIWIGKKPGPHEPVFNYHSILSEKFPKRFICSPANRLTGLKKILSKFPYGFKHISKKSTGNDRLAITPCKIAVFLCFNEWEKFTEPVEDMKQHFGKELSVFYLGPDDSPIYRWSEKNGIKVNKIIYPKSIDNDIRSYFNSQKQKWLSKGRYELSKATGCRIIEDSALLPFFNNFYDHSMPFTAQLGRNIHKMLDRAEPSLIVGSSAYAKDGILPYYIARNRNIPSIALSHTYVPGELRKVSADYFICRNLFEREHYRRTFFNETNVIYCKNSINRLSYNCGQTNEKNKNKYISILVTETGSSNLLISLYDNLSAVKTFQSLCTPPSDFDNMEFIFKSHPRFDLSPLISNFHKKKNVSVISPSVSIKEIVKNARINIVCNHYGGEVAECIIAEKPVIFLDTADFCYPDLQKPGHKAGMVVKDMEKFWDTLYKLLYDSRFYDEMTNRCKNFKNKYFTVSQNNISVKITKLL